VFIAWIKHMLVTIDDELRMHSTIAYHKVPCQNQDMLFLTLSW
jgi:hypothetical protein